MPHTADTAVAHENPSRARRWDFALAVSRRRCIVDRRRSARMPARNVLGTELEVCSLNPTTGWYRDGCCNTGGRDTGLHLVCARVTEEFLAYSVEQGNDLVTPNPDWDFPGLQPGDQWCVC